MVAVFGVVAAVADMYPVLAEVELQVEFEADERVVENSVGTVAGN